MHKQLQVRHVLLLAAFRTLNALCLQTYFVPDEYWQGPEVAHRLVFGYGHLTWEWIHGLRGSIQPLIIATLYRIVQMAGLDSTLVIRMIPRLVSAMVATAGDCATFELARRFFGHAVAWQALLCEIFSCSYFYCMARPLSNCLETALTTWALALWPWQGLIEFPALFTCLVHARRVALLLACLSFAVRPTSAIIFSPLVLSHVWSLRKCGSPRCGLHASTDGSMQTCLAGRVGAGALDWQAAIMFAFECVGAFTLASAILVVADYICYGRWIYSPYNFFVFNVKGGGSIYGTHPWHWYLTEGFPILLMTSLPLVFRGISASTRLQRSLLRPLICSTLAHSALPHKEFRFLLPVVPLALCYAGKGLQTLASGQSPEAASRRRSGRKPGAKAELKEDSSGKQREEGLRHGPTGVGRGHWGARWCDRWTLAVWGQGGVTGGRWVARWCDKWTLAVGVVAGTQFVAAMYLSLVHQRGAVDVIKWIAAQAQATSRHADPSVLFLMPCHSTPLYSEIHREIRVRSLDCAPRGHRPPHGLDRNCSQGALAEELDEADRFYSDPQAFLRCAFETGEPPVSAPLASHIVCFADLASTIAPFLQRQGYRPVLRVFHTHLPLESRISTHIHVYANSHFPAP